MRNALILTLWFSARVLAADLTPTEVDAVLEKIPPTIGRSLEFREEKFLRLLKEPVVSEGKLWFQAPDHFRREIEKPHRTVSISNGQILWLYYPEFNEAETYDLRKNHPISRMLEALTASFDIRKLRQLFEIQAAPTPNGITLRLRPKNSGLRKNVQDLTLELSSAGRLTRSTLVMKDGSRSITTYQNEKNHPLDPNLFEFSPPNGTKVIAPMGD